ncbi:sensor histidine kinase [Hyalangium gracile]|uniref:sensor histidine kinase n=1 Tax=Hyalangium gracile TaxID=394092 RepID=UPI001CCEDA9F|nr:ATP-binding protein [Hyalangium gracile]
MGDQLFFIGLIALLGATSSPFFSFLFVFPIIHSLTYPLAPRAVLGSGVTAALGHVVLGLSDDVPLLKLLLWVLLTGGATFFGIRASAQARRMLEAEAQARMERERRELLEQLALASYQRIQSEKMVMLGRLAANVVHELNNPLAYARSSIRFLQEDVLSPPQQPSAERAEAFHDALHGLERIQEIVSDLRGFSLVEGTEPEQCTVKEAVQDASRIARLRLKHVAQLQVHLPEALPEVRASPRKLAQVLVNLMVNAADALEQADIKQGEIRVRALHQEDQVVLLVEDNGPGIPPKVLERLFEPFFTTKGPEKGTGLGLALSRSMVEGFGGSLVAENRAEGGACLRLSLRATSLPPPV